MTEGKRQIIRGLLEEYEIETAQDIQDALKDLLGGTIKEMMEAELEDHLGYGKSERIDRTEINDYRNGTKPTIELEKALSVAWMLGLNLNTQDKE